MSQAILKWLGGRDTGLSSKAIALTALGQMPDDPRAPSDAADFGRCVRLIDAAPEAAEALSVLAHAGGAEWGALVARWAELCQTYRDETEGRAPGATTKLMRSILDPIRDADPRWARLGNGVSVRFGR